LFLIDLVGDQGGELDHLVEPVMGIQHWVVGGFEPYGTAHAVEALEAPGDVLAAVELRPEIAICRRIALLG